MLPSRLAVSPTLTATMGPDLAITFASPSLVGVGVLGVGAGVLGAGVPPATGVCAELLLLPPPQPPSCRSSASNRVTATNDVRSLCLVDAVNMLDVLVPLTGTPGASARIDDELG